MQAKIEQFPAKNPNPALSVGKDGNIIYSNEACEPLLRKWGVKKGKRLPSEIGNIVQHVISR
jgi:hypothetical protein